MRLRWKILSGTGVVSIWTAAFIIGQSGVVQGDTASSGSTTSTAAGVDPKSLHDPFTPYPLGPGAIPYDQLSAADKAAVDQIQETVETNQPASYHQVLAEAVTLTGQHAQLEIAARSVGLVGTDQDGVVP